MDRCIPNAGYLVTSFKDYLFHVGEIRSSNDSSRVHLSSVGSNKYISVYDARFESRPLSLASLERNRRQRVTATELLDEIAHSLRHHGDPDFSIQYVLQSLFVIWKTLHDIFDRGTSSPVGKQVIELYGEVERIRRALQAMKEKGDLAPGVNYRLREDEGRRRRVAKAVSELAARIGDVRGKIQAIGELGDEMRARGPARIEARRQRERSG